MGFVNRRRAPTARVAGARGAGGYQRPRHIRGAWRVKEGMTARMNNPANVLPDSMKGIQSIIKAAHSAGVPQSTMELAHLRASQINGCSPCVYSGAISAKKAGESDERLYAVAAWRETDLFTDAE